MLQVNLNLVAIKLNNNNTFTQNSSAWSVAAVNLQIDLFNWVSAKEVFFKNIKRISVHADSVSTSNIIVL